MIECGHVTTWGLIVTRELIVRGRVHRMFAAVRTDAMSPATEFLDLLKHGQWRLDSEHRKASGWPDNAQIDDHAALLDLLRHYADNRTGYRRSDINALDAGIWEFKVGAKRLSYYDTDGHGNTTVRERVASKEECVRGAGDPCWHVPNFDPQIRLGHPFPKHGRFARPQDIEATIVVREEDLARDRAA